jgi:small subunit ribosomal protein S7
MSRVSSSASRRPLPVDPRYNSLLVTKLINRTMRDGKRNAACKQVYRSLEIVADTLKRDGLEVLEEVIQRITPAMEVRSRRVGGASYQVPMPVREDRALSLAIRWLINESNKRANASYHTFADKLAAEMLAALNEEGGAYGKKITTHKMADANKAFAHFRW